MVKHVKVEEVLEIPDDVEINVDGNKITVKGNKGQVTKDFSHAKGIEITLTDDEQGKKLSIWAPFPRNRTISTIYTIKNIIDGMIKGVQKGYVYKMKIVYSHFPITVEPPKGDSREIKIKNFIGERAPRITYTIGDVVVKADKQEVVVSGCDKEAVGQTCANIQLRCRIRDKDKRVFKDGIYVYAKYLGDELLWKIK